MFHIFSRSQKAIFKGYLPELDGHKVYFQVFGNPNGKTIINFHGGPGGKSKFKHVKHFDLKKYKAIIFDPRKSELKQINLDSFFHANIPHIFTGKIAGKDIEHVNSVEKIEEIYLTGYKNQLMQKGTKNLQSKSILFDSNERD